MSASTEVDTPNMFKPISLSFKKCYSETHFLDMPFLKLTSSPSKTKYFNFGDNFTWFGTAGRNIWRPWAQLWHLWSILGFISDATIWFCLLQAQFLNLLLCRCFQLSYLEKHPEEAQEDSAGSVPHRNPSLLNHGFPLSVSALVSFRRAPFLGLLPGTKVWTASGVVFDLLISCAKNPFFIAPHSSTEEESKGFWWS